jgi:DNA-binding transcriptional LysR family regulator
LIAKNGQERYFNAGLGVSLVLRSAVAEEVRNGSLRAIPIQRPALEKDLFVIWRDTGVSHISAPAFVTHLLGDGWKKAGTLLTPRTSRCLH